MTNTTTVTAWAGITLGDLRELLTRTIGAPDDTPVYGKVAMEIRLSRDPKIVRLSIMTEADPS